jgi:hypothetical protein
VRGHRRRRRCRRRERGAAGPVWSGHLTQLSHMCFSAPGRPPTRSPRRRSLRPSPPSVGPQARASAPRPPSESARARQPTARGPPVFLLRPRSRTRLVGLVPGSRTPGVKADRPRVSLARSLGPGSGAGTARAVRPGTAGRSRAGLPARLFGPPEDPDPRAHPCPCPDPAILRCVPARTPPRAPRLTRPHRAPRPRPAPPTRALRLAARQ